MSDDKPSVRAELTEAEHGWLEAIVQEHELPDQGTWLITATTTITIITTTTITTTTSTSIITTTITTTTTTSTTTSQIPHSAISPCHPNSHLFPHQARP
jgi:hypothetical protein